MPSSATITAFYFFAPFTKARAVQLNNNFGNLRGHILPVEPSTATASDQTYDLGSTDHRWRTGYATTISLSMSMGSSQVFSGTTAGGFKFVNGATTTLAIQGSNFQALNATPMNQTTTAAIGSFAASPPINTTLTSNVFVAGTTCTLTTVGRPVLVGLMNVGNTAGSSGLFFRELTVGGITIPVGIKFGYLANGTTIGSNYLGVGRTGAGALGNPNSYFYFPSGAMLFLHFPVAGTYNFSLGVEATTTSYANIGMTLQNVRMFAFEL